MAGELKVGSPGAPSATPQPKVFACPSCGANITIRAVGLTISAACGSCGSVIDVADENHKILSKAAKNLNIEPLIPLGTKGKFKGNVWQVIGFMRRSDDTGSFVWEEYFLFNPLKGFRWLTQGEGHWNFVLRTTNKPSNNFHRGVHYLDKDYRLFHSGSAKVLFVVGEFSWRVKVGDQAVVKDFINPPEILSMEKLKDEVSWSIGEYVEPEDVQAAFSIDQTKMPARWRTAPNQPSAASQLAPTLWKYAVCFIGLLFFIQLLTMIFSRGEQIFAQKFTLNSMDKDVVQVSQPFDLKKARNTLAFQLWADVNNAWLATEVDLVNESNGETVSFEQGVEYYSGSDYDGHWSEGTRTHEAVLSDIPAGRYHLVLRPQGSMLESNSSVVPATAPPPEPASVLPEKNPGATVQPDLIKQSWPNGQVKSLEPLKDGKFDGIAHYYHDNGKMYASIPWVQGRKHGHFTLFRSDGSREQELSYKHGLPHGQIIFFDNNGTVSAIQNYENGVLVDRAQPTAANFSISVIRGVVIWQNFLIALPLLALIPLFIAWRRHSVEYERWSQSDYSPYPSHHGE